MFFIYFIVLLILSDGSYTFPWSSSFQVVVVKTADSRDCVSCSTTCFLLFLGELGFNYKWLHLVVSFALWLPRFGLWIHVLFLSEELQYRIITLNYDVLLWRYQVGCFILGRLSLGLFLLEYGQLLFILVFCMLCLLQLAICLYWEINESRWIQIFMWLKVTFPLPCLSLIFWLLHR